MKNIKDSIIEAIQNYPGDIKQLKFEIPVIIDDILEITSEVENSFQEMWNTLKNSYKQVICPPKIGELKLMKIIEDNIRRRRRIIKIRYTGRNLIGDVYSKVFTIEEIEQGNVFNWIKENNIVQSSIKKLIKHS
jgi:hypothetical protein